MASDETPGRGRIWLALAVLLLCTFAVLTAGSAEKDVWTLTPRNERAEAAAALEKTEMGFAEQDRAQALLAELTLREQVLQMFIVTPSQLDRAQVENRAVGGVIFFAEDIQTPEQVTGQIAALQSASAIGMFISVDEEGGRVARLGSNPAMGMTKLPDMGGIASDEAAYQVGLTLAGELGRYGFNLDFAPVADVNSNPANPVIGSRAFSSDPETAAGRVAACVAGFREGGMLCTLKHFPGHGDTAADSHLGAAVSGKTLEELRQCELLPFAAGIEAGAPLVMVGHISLPRITGDETPACLSEELTTGLLRRELGFAGVIITDSMSMRAITDGYTAAEAAVLAIRAGADIVLMPEDLDAAVEGVMAALEAGELTEQRIDESVTRILSLKLEQGIIS